jgi:hypothetical protein
MGAHQAWAEQSEVVATETADNQHFNATFSIE